MAQAHKTLSVNGLRDLRGVRFGSLLVKQRVRTPQGQAQKWLCVCDCGNTLTVAHYCFVRKIPKTHCGCKVKTLASTHKQEYGIWQMMHTRCESPKHVAYKSYGGRGISVCERWAIFDNFLADMGERPSPKHSLDRIDPDGNYEPGNVRWSDSKTQAQNKRKSLFLEHPHIPGRMIPAAQVAEILGITYQQLRYLYRKEGKWPTP